MAPLVRLTNRKGVKIEDIGAPEGIIQSLGPFITGGRGAGGCRACGWEGLLLVHVC